jgi:hypothetical protein
LSQFLIGFAISAGYNQPATGAAMKTITKQEAQEFKDRWEFVNNFIAHEIRNTPPEIKLQQLSVMFIIGESRSPVSLAEEQEVRNRWRFLKQKANV